MSSSNKPQIFINHVDHHISSDAIKSVCEAICGGKSTVTLRPSHDKNYQTCTISLSSQEEVQKLLEKSESFVVDGVKMKLEQYQAQYPNLFLKNTLNLTQAQLEEALHSLIKGYFHIYYGNGSVSFFIQDEKELTKLISESQTVGGKTVNFQKYVTPTKDKNNLYLQFVAPFKIDFIAKELEKKLREDFGPLEIFNNKGVQQSNCILINVVFQNSSDAVKFHNNVQQNFNKLYDQLVNVSWKKGEDSESSDRILYVRNLKEDVNDQIVKNTLEKFAKVVSVEIKWVSKGDVQKKNAFVEMSSKDECEKLCIKSHAEAEIKNLFLFQKPQIAAYLPKSEISAFINIQTNSLPIQIQQQIVQQQLHQNQGFPIPDNKQFVHPGQPIYPFFTNPQFIPQDGQFPGVYGVNAFPQQFPYGKKPYRNHPYNAQFGGDQQQQFSQQPQPQHPQHQHPHQYQHRNQHQQQRPHNQQRSNNNNNYNNNRNNRHQNNRPNQFIPMQSQFPLPQQAFQQFQQFPPNPNQIPPQAVFPNVVDQVTSQTNQESALAWCSKTTAEEIKRKISSDKSIYETYVKEAIKELASKEVQTKYPAYISFLEQIVDMLTDPETFQEDDVVDLIYNTTQFQDFVKEGVDLIEDDKNNKSNE